MDTISGHTVAVRATYPHPDALRILPGLVPPRALLVPRPDGEEKYVRYDCATLDDLERAVLDETTRTTAELAVVRADRAHKLTVLRPLMADFPTRTVLEACDILCALAATRHNVQQHIRE